MFDEMFVRKTLNKEKALSFGFVQLSDEFIYETDILGDTFRLMIVISSIGNLNTVLTEKETGDEYTLYKTDITGSFVGEVREAVKAVLSQIAVNCYEVDIFKSQQAKDIICYIRNKYGDELEFLWEKFPDNAVWRRKDTAKWYGAILTVTKNKLGIDSNEKAEIIDLRIQPEKMEELLSDARYYPGWHMNKKNWYTIILDGSVPTSDLCARIDESFRLAL